MLRKEFAILNKTVLTIILSCLFITMCYRIYDNPVSDDYEGDYRYSISWNDLPDTLELFTPYTIICTDSGTDKHWKFDASSSDIFEACTFSIAAVTKDTYAITVYARDLFTGTIQVHAIRPNHKSTSKEKEVTVINPYKISGNRRNGISSQASYYVCRQDNKPASQTFKTIWNTESTNPVNSITRDTLMITKSSPVDFHLYATIQDNNGNKFPLNSLRITFIGYIPVIDKVSPVDTLRLGINPIIDIFYTDKDSSAIRFIVLANTDTIGDTLFTDKTEQSIRLFCTRPINDTSNIMLSVTASDSSYTSIPYTKAIPVSYLLPEITFSFEGDLFETQFYYPVTFTAKGDARQYRWINDNKDTFYTMLPLLTLETIEDSLTHSISVQGTQSQFHNFYGKKDYLRYRARIF